MAENKELPTNVKIDPNQGSAQKELAKSKEVAAGITKHDAKDKPAPDQEKSAEKVPELKEVSNKELTKLVDVAKEKFAHIGGNTTAFVTQALLPVLKEAGIKLVK